MLIKLLALVVPLGLAGAVSPVLLTEQTVLLSTPGGRRIGRVFALGAILTLTAFVVVLVLFGRSIELPKTPHLNAQLDVVVGVLLLALALVLRLRQQAKPKATKPKGEMSVRGAFSFGCFAMATNFTTLALMVPAAKEVASSQLDVAGRAVAAIVLIALASIPAWLPLLLTAIVPETADRILVRMNDLTSKRGRQIGQWLLIGVGVYFSARGITRLM